MPNYTNTKWTDKQLQVRKRFAIVSEFCQQHKLQVIFPIWNLLPGNSSGYNLFLGTNIKAFDSEGKIMDMSLLKFSQGSLPGLYQVKVTKQQEAVEINWFNDVGASSVRLKDNLWYMAVVDSQVTGPYQTGLTRGMQGGVFTLSNPATSAIYAFFGASDKNSYSPDRYLEF